MKGIQQEVSNLVLSMWDRHEDEIAGEVCSCFEITREYAKELVEQAIQEEYSREAELSFDEWGDEQ